MKSASVFICDEIVNKTNLKNFENSTNIELNGNHQKLKSQVFLNEAIEEYQYCRVVMEEIMVLTARTGDDYFSEVIVKKEYDVFINCDEKTLICIAGKKPADRIKKIFEEMLKVNFEFHKFNLEEITADSSNIKKANFKELTIQTLTSSILQGNRINETEMFLELLENGEIRNITAVYPFGNKDVSFLISSQGTIVIYSILAKEEILTLIKELKDK